MTRGPDLRVALIFLFLFFAPITTRAQTIAKPSPTPPSQPVEIDPDDVIRVKTSLVNSPVLVMGRNGKFVPTLQRDDFEVFEQGVKQEVAYFSAVDSPYTVALVIDTSRSTLFSLEEIKASAIAFVEQMRPNDRALVVTFSDDIKPLLEATNDQSTLKKVIQEIRPGGASRVYDAVHFTLAGPLAGMAGRKALLLFTDGVDNDSREATAESTLHLVQRNETIVHPIQFGTYEAMQKRSRSKQPAFEGSGFSRQDYLRADHYLHQLADISGTGVYPALNISDLDRVVATIVDELHNEYSIGYYPQTVGQPGEVRKVEIKVKRPQLTARARTGYVVDRSGVLIRSASKSLNPLTTSENSQAIPAPRGEAFSKPPVGSRWICKGPGVASDLAVVKEAVVAECPKSSRANDETNAWFIKKPGAKETVCKGFLVWNGKELAGAPIPHGYVVTGQTFSAVCSRAGGVRDSPNAWSVQTPGQGILVCKGFILPRGFVVAGERSSAACPRVLNGKNAWVIQAK